MHKIAKKLRTEHVGKYQGYMLQRPQFIVSLASDRLNIPLLVAVSEILCETETQIRS